jgi:hypothetical protein
MSLSINTAYQLEPVLTDGGHCLYKGGVVELIHIFPKGEVPSAELITKHYGFQPGTKAHDGVAIAFKEDRYVFNRVNPMGKPVVLLEKYLKFVAEDTFSAKLKPHPTMSQEEVERLKDFIADLMPGQVWQYGDTKVEVQSVHRSDDGTPLTIVLGHYFKDRNGSVQWISGHPIDVFMTAKCFIINQARMISSDSSKYVAPLCC